MARRSKNELADEVKAFLVTCFAMGMSPTQVAEAATERFELDPKMDKRHAHKYDPTSRNGQAQLGKRWKRLYAEVRERFLSDIADIPIANRSVRLQQLQLHYEKAIANRNIGMALSILEKAAKEAGNFHTNEATVHHHHSGRVASEKVGEDEMRNIVGAAIARELEKMSAKGDPAPATRH